MEAATKLEVKGVLNVILDPCTPNEIRLQERFQLMGKMREDSVFANEVATIVLSRIRTMSIGNYKTEAVCNILAILLGGYQISFSAEVAEKIAAMSEWGRWSMLNKKSMILTLINTDQAAPFGD